jgi:hypothetical protein
MTTLQSIMVSTLVRHRRVLAAGIQRNPNAFAFPPGIFGYDEPYNSSDHSHE